MNKRAFTLAEVLITLGIIGVVAAMTLPSLIKQTQGKELEAQLKKAYSVIQTAYNQMTYDERQILNKTDYPANTFRTKFMKYFKTIKDCGNSSCENSSINDEGDIDYSSKHYKTYNNKTMNIAALDDGQFFISDGMFIMIENTGGGPYFYITVDVNGYNKKPNRWGHDLFTFQITDNGKLLPMGAPGTSFTNFEYFCSTTSTQNGNGIACTYKALTDKNYFKNLPK